MKSDRSPLWMEWIFRLIVLALLGLWLLVPTAGVPAQSLQVPFMTGIDHE